MRPAPKNRRNSGLAKEGMTCSEHNAGGAGMSQASDREIGLAGRSRRLMLRAENLT